ncbi:heterokaryon incompatibility protein-domain-containing protein [Aspergillus pseudotamarii]|uniref:Heterokaryon incompatibility protein-domain-containing protein n=1 Tax=Aspergillus pseudotamarii TaxID=132259 RepID=A0A5N6SMQ4_ASPPS|nr:heterokaryon incompatibility protein-domain-containing protein [Aspergillus pseudotamarii]KAE8135976.1 heterokaryon incompatibility protein-domain-containing protein [Aspergillus pseudotamarii]
MGGYYEPGVVELLLTTTFIILVLVLLPLGWLGLILWNLGRIVSGSTNARNAVSDIGSSLNLIWALPLCIVNNLRLLLVKLLRVFYAYRNRPAPSNIARRHYTRPFATGKEISVDPYLLPEEEQYIYTPIMGEHKIRLLVIQPGSFNDWICGDVVEANLLLGPTFDALSYTWADEKGDASRSGKIYCVPDFSVIEITKNCDMAIRRLRHPKKKRRIWIDAVCINQQDAQERTHQIAQMSKIFTSARRVIAYTGEGTPQTDTLFDWLNGLDISELNVPLIGGLDDLSHPIATIKEPADLRRVIARIRVGVNERIIMAGMYGKRCFSKSPHQSGTANEKISIKKAELTKFALMYCSRRWFKRVWILQEVILPDLHRTRIVCGSRTTTAERALHALGLLKETGAGSIPRIFVVIRKPTIFPKRCYLLDILMETKDHLATDPRDKIFAVLSLSHSLDGGSFPELEANYELNAAQVYTRYSAFFIQHHGPGFFLALIQSPQKLPGLPSWAADWTVPWPNSRAVSLRDLPAVSRRTEEENSGNIFSQENGYEILTLVRPQILRGYFTRNGALTGLDGIEVEEVGGLLEDTVLVEIYPGLAALLRQEDDYYIFIQVCPHAMFQDSLLALVERWSTVVVDGIGPEELQNQDCHRFGYLGSAKPFKIRPNLTIDSHYIFYDNYFACPVDTAYRIENCFAYTGFNSNYIAILLAKYHYSRR